MKDIPYEVTHLLGYLNADHWNEAFSDDGLDNEVLEELVNEQENVYGGIKQDIKYFQQGTIE